LVSLGGSALKPKIDPERWYTAAEAAPFLRIKDDTVKEHCRKKTIRGKQIGPLKVWSVQGREIIRKRKEWNLDP